MAANQGSGPPPFPSPPARRSSYASVAAGASGSAFAGTASPLPGLAGPGIGGSYSGGGSRFGYGSSRSTPGGSGSSSAFARPVSGTRRAGSGDRSTYGGSSAASRSGSRPISRSQATAVDEAVQVASWAQRGGANTSSVSLPPYPGGSISSSPFNGNAFGLLGKWKDGFFVPSYLKGSKFAERLEAIHRTRLYAANTGTLSSSSSSANLQKMGNYGTATHRGLSLEVTERTPFASSPILKSTDTSASAVDPLPARLSSEMKAPMLELQAYQSYPNLEVRLGSTPNSRPSHDDAASIRADHPIPRAAGVYYFEVTVVGGSRSRSEGLVSVGMTTTQAPLNRLPGWESESWAYHGDDGAVFASSSNGRPYGPKFTNGDVIGCGIIWREKGGESFFTKNGHHLGVAFQNIKPASPLYPSVGVKKPGEAVRINFGQFPFVFDIDSEIDRERSLVAQDVATTSTADLRPRTSETALIQQLIAQYLAHEGYVESARAFAEEVQHESRTLSSTNGSDGGVAVGVEEDINAVHRQRIRTAVLTGDIDRAIKLTRTFYPHVLDANENIYFKLKCRKFVEMIRAMTESAQSPSSVNGTNGTNGHSYASVFHDSDDEAMKDVDGTDLGMVSQNSAPENGKGLPRGDADMLQEALRFGQELRAEWSKDPRREVQQALEDTLALIAYTNPAESPLKWMLGREGREAIAEELGGCILVSLGKSSTAALEKMVAHTEALVDMLAEDGVPGALVNVRKDFLR